MIVLVLYQDFIIVIHFDLRFFFEASIYLFEIKNNKKKDC